MSNEKMKTEEFAKRFITKTPTASIVETSRDFVDWALSVNTHNRSIKNHVANIYADDMKAGEWMLTAQGVGFSKSGFLLDGQHRLLANKNAGYPTIPLVVVTGLDPDAQLKTDIHSRRTPSDLLFLAVGVFTDPTLTSALTMLSRIDSDKSISSQYGRVPIKQVAASFERYSDTIGHVVFPKTRGLGAGFIAAVLRAVFYEISPDLAKRFIAGVRTGENLTKGDPRLALRRVLIEGTARSIGGRQAKQIRAPDVFALTARALRAYADGETLDYVQHPEWETAAKMFGPGGAK